MSLDGAAFCQKCGATLIIDETSQQKRSTLVSVPKPIEPAPGPVTSIATVTAETTSSVQKKKSTSSLLGIVGGVVAVIALVVIVASIIGTPDYIKYVKGWKPYTDYGVSATVGVVFDKYLAPCEWTQAEHGNGVTYYVNANGKLDGNTAQMRFFLNESNKTISWGVTSFKLGDDTFEKEDAEAWFESFFDAYEAGASSFSEYYDGFNIGIGAEGQQQQSISNTIGSRIVFGETQLYDVDGIGNLEVTLDYVEFVDKIENELHAWNPDVIPQYDFPDEGSLFLRATLTVKNIGTESGTLLTAWNTVVYDGVYEYRHHFVEGDWIGMKPLAPPTTGAIIFEIPNAVAESDGPLVLCLNDSAGEVVISYIIRPGVGDPAGQGISGGSGSVADHDQAYNIAQAWLDEHLFPASYGTPSLSHEVLEVTIDGEEYYLINAGMHDLLEIAVNKETGDLFSYWYYSSFELPEGADGVVPLDEWYYSSFCEGELLYAGVPVHWFFSYYIYDVVDAFGSPLEEEYDDWYSGGAYYAYEGITFFFDNSTSQITYIGLTPDACEVDEITLDKNRAGLIALLGVPVYEGWDDGEIGGYYVSYDRSEYSFRVELYDPEIEAHWMIMWSNVGQRGV